MSFLYWTLVHSNSTLTHNFPATLVIQLTKKIWSLPEKGWPWRQVMCTTSCLKFINSSSMKCLIMVISTAKNILWRKVVISSIDCFLFPENNFNLNLSVKTSVYSLNGIKAQPKDKINERTNLCLRNNLYEKTAINFLYSSETCTLINKNQTQ